MSVSRLSPEKTKIISIDEGFDFLGQDIRRYNGLVLVKPSKKNALAFLTIVRERIRATKGATQEKLIRTLNPIIRGWTNSPSGISLPHTPTARWITPFG